MTTPRIHGCGEPMNRAVLSSHSRTPKHRGQPTWSCWQCQAWEPHEDWEGALPDEWDGRRWTTEEEMSP